MKLQWPWRATGRHFKLMAATTIVALVLVPFLLAYDLYLGAAGVLLWLLTVLVQWLCIEPPDVNEDDLH